MIEPRARARVYVYVCVSVCQVVPSEPCLFKIPLAVLQLPPHPFPQSSRLQADLRLVNLLFVSHSLSLSQNLNMVSYSLSTKKTNLAVNDTDISLGQPASSRDSQAGLPRHAFLLYMETQRCQKKHALRGLTGPTDVRYGHIR